MSSSDKECDFEFYLKLVGGLVVNLTHPNDKALAAAWVQKLRDDKVGTEKLRTDYLKLLLFVLQRQKLIGLFSKKPSEFEKLEEFPETDLNKVAKNLLENEERYQKVISSNAVGEKGDSPQYATEYSEDLLEYSAAQEIPNFGIHAYYAISNEPLPKWDHSEKAVFSKALALSQHDTILTNSTYKVPSEKKIIYNIKSECIPLRSKSDHSIRLTSEDISYSTLRSRTKSNPDLAALQDRIDTKQLKEDRDPSIWESDIIDVLNRPICQITTVPYLDNKLKVLKPTMFKAEPLPENHYINQLPSSNLERYPTYLNFQASLENELTSCSSSSSQESTYPVRRITALSGGKEYDINNLSSNFNFDDLDNELEGGNESRGDSFGNQNNTGETSQNIPEYERQRVASSRQVPIQRINRYQRTERITQPSTSGSRTSSPSPRDNAKSRCKGKCSGESVGSRSGNGTSQTSLTRIPGPSYQQPATARLRNTVPLPTNTQTGARMHLIPSGSETPCPATTRIPLPTSTRRPPIQLPVSRTPLPPAARRIPISNSATRIPLPGQSCRRISPQMQSTRVPSPRPVYRSPVLPAGEANSFLFESPPSFMDQASASFLPTSPTFPQGEASPFFLESPPEFLTQTSLPYYSPTFPQGEAEPFFLESPPQFLAQANLFSPTPTRSPRIPSPHVQPPIRELYDTKVLEEHELQPKNKLTTGKAALNESPVLTKSKVRTVFVDPDQGITTTRSIETITRIQDGHRSRSPHTPRGVPVNQSLDSFEELERELEISVPVGAKPITPSGDTKRRLQAAQAAANRQYEELMEEAVVADKLEYRPRSPHFPSTPPSDQMQDSFEQMERELGIPAPVGTMPITSTVDERRRRQAIEAEANRQYQELMLADELDKPEHQYKNRATPQRRPLYQSPDSFERHEREMGITVNVRPKTPPSESRHRMQQAQAEANRQYQELMLADELDKPEYQYKNQATPQRRPLYQSPDSFERHEREMGITVNVRPKTPPSESRHRMQQAQAEANRQYQELMLADELDKPEYQYKNRATPQRRPLYQSPDSFERHEREMGITVNVRPKTPPSESRHRIQQAQAEANRQYRELVKHGELADEYDRYRQRYQYRRPDVPNTPPLFSKYASVIGPEAERQYSPSEFGLNQNIDWVPAEQYFEGRTRLSPRTHERGDDVKQLITGVQRQIEAEEFFSRESLPEYLELLDIDVENKQQLSSSFSSPHTPQTAPRPIPKEELRRVYFESPPIEFYESPGSSPLSPGTLKALPTPYGLPRRAIPSPIAPIDAAKLRQEANLREIQRKAERQFQMLSSPQLNKQEEDDINLYIRPENRELMKRIANIVSDVPDTFERPYPYREWELPTVSRRRGILNETPPLLPQSPPPISPSTPQRVVTQKASPIPVRPMTPETQTAVKSIASPISPLTLQENAQPIDIMEETPPDEFQLELPTASPQKGDDCVVCKLNTSGDINVQSSSTGACEHLSLLQPATKRWHAPPRKIKVAQPRIERVLESPIRIPQFTYEHPISGVKRTAREFLQQHQDLPIIPLPEDLFGTTAEIDWQTANEINELDRSIPGGLQSPMKGPIVIPGWVTPPRLTRQGKLSPIKPFEFTSDARPTIYSEQPPTDLYYSPPCVAPSVLKSQSSNVPTRQTPIRQAWSPQAWSPPAWSPPAQSPPMPSNIYDELPPTGFDYSPPVSPVPQRPLPKLFNYEPQSGDLENTLHQQLPPTELYYSPPYISPVTLHRERPPTELAYSPPNVPSYESQYQAQLFAANPTSGFLQEDGLNLECEEPPAELYYSPLTKTAQSPTPKKLKTITSIRKLGIDNSNPSNPMVTEVVETEETIEDAQPMANIQNVLNNLDNRYSNLSELQQPASPTTVIRSRIKQIQKQQLPTLLDRSLPNDLPSPIKPPTVVYGWKTPPHLQKPVKPTPAFEFKLHPNLRDIVFQERPPPELNYSIIAGSPKAGNDSLPSEEVPSSSIAKQTDTQAQKETSPQISAFDKKPQFLVLEMPPEEFMPPGSPPSPEQIGKPTIQPMSPDTTVDSFEQHEKSAQEGTELDTPDPDIPKPKISPITQLENMNEKIAQQYKALEESEKKITAASPSRGSLAKKTLLRHYRSPNTSIEEFEMIERDICPERLTAATQPPPISIADKIEKVIATAEQQYAELLDTSGKSLKEFEALEREVCSSTSRQVRSNAPPRSAITQAIDNAGKAQQQYKELLQSSIRSLDEFEALERELGTPEQIKTNAPPRSAITQAIDNAGKAQQQYKELLQSSIGSLDEFEALERELGTPERIKTNAPPKSVILKTIHNAGIAQRQYAELERSPTWLDRVESRIRDVPDPHLPRGPPLYSPQQRSLYQSPKLPRAPRFINQIDLETMPKEMWDYSSPKTPPATYQPQVTPRRSPPLPSVSPCAAQIDEEFMPEEMLEYSMSSTSSSPNAKSYMATFGSPEVDIFGVEPVSEDLLDSILQPDLANSPENNFFTPPDINDYYQIHTPPSPGSPTNLAEEIRCHKYTDQFYDRKKKMLSPYIQVKNKRVPSVGMKKPQFLSIQESPMEGSSHFQRRAPAREIIEQIVEEVVEEINPDLIFATPQKANRAARPPFAYVSKPSYKDDLMYESPPSFYQSPRRDLFEEFEETYKIDTTPPEGLLFSPPNLSPGESPSLFYQSPKQDILKKYKETQAIDTSPPIGFSHSPPNLSPGESPSLYYQSPKQEIFEKYKETQAIDTSPPLGFNLSPPNLSPGESPSLFYQSPKQEIFEKYKEGQSIDTTPPMGLDFSPSNISPIGRPLQPYLGFTPPQDNYSNLSSPGPASPGFKQSVKEHQYVPGRYVRENRFYSPLLGRIEEQYNERADHARTARTPSPSQQSPRTYNLPTPDYYGSPGRQYVRTPTGRTEPTRNPDEEEAESWQEDSPCCCTSTRLPFEGMDSSPIMDTSLIPSDLDASYLEEDLANYKWMK